MSSVGLFWLSAALIAYVYVGYPLLLHAWSRFRPRREGYDRSIRFTPGVSIVIAARNEGHRIAGRIENLLQLDYPAERRQIIVVSDGSTDDTLAVLDRYRGCVEAVSIPAGGKALALNAGVSRARFDVLVFGDTRQAFAPDALRELVAPLQNPEVGAVTGELLLGGEAQDRRLLGGRRHMTGPAPASGERRVAERRTACASTIADAVGLYWRYEKCIRRDESAVASTLGATGAIYALRRALWLPLPANTILDDVLAPMRCAMAGFRLVFNDRARAFDRAAADAKAEGQRKLRTLAGNYQLLWLEPALLLPWRNPVWLQFVSHKLGRLIVPYALVGVLASSAALAAESTTYAAALSAQTLFYLFGGYGAWLDRRPVRGAPSRPAKVPPGIRQPRVVDRFARIAFTFMVMNGSAVAGLGAIVLRRKVWR